MTPTDDLISRLRSINTDDLVGDEAQRIRVRDALFETLRKVQSPWDVAWEMNWVNAANVACIKTMIDMAVFSKWSEHGFSPKTNAEIASFTNKDVNLIRRLTRHLAGQHLLVEVGEETYAPTRWSRAFVEHHALTGPYAGFHNWNAKTLMELPSFLESIDWQNPTDGTSCNFHHAHKTKDNAFLHMSTTDPEAVVSFNDAMECHSRYNLVPWTTLYPTETVVSAGRTKPDRVLVVDVGGGKGHDLSKFAAKHPGVGRGSLVLQDLPDMIKTGVAPDAEGKISIQPHDFLTPQPVRGARAYFMHNVIHDWDDDAAVEILRQITPAMERGYSRLLLHESLVDRVNPLARVTSSDLAMLAWFSSHERTEKEWHGLMGRCGLKITNIYRPVGLTSPECVIEAELAETSNGHSYTNGTNANGTNGTNGS